MSELRFGGRDDPNLPPWLNPNVFLQQTPDDPSPTRPVINQPIFILCSVRNSGTQPTTGATIKFFICNPATVPTPSMCQLVGQSFVDLDAGETKEVLCLSPWKPTTVGHFCIVCEISAPDDPSPFTSDGPWNILDRHVAQHNVNVLEPPLKRAHLASILVAGLPHQPFSTVVVRRASNKEFEATLKIFEGGSLVRRNVTAAVKVKLLKDFRCGDQLPSIDGFDDESVIKEITPDEQRPLGVAVQLPDDSDHLSAAVVYVEQLDINKNLLGGVAVVALSHSLPAVPRLMRQRPGMPFSVPFRPYSTLPKSNLMTPDGIFCSNFGHQNINVQIRNDGPSTLGSLSVYVEGVADPNIALSYSRSSPPDGVARASASFKSVFQGDFSRAASRETLISFIVQQQAGVSSQSVRIVKKIFVLGIAFNKTNKTFTVNIPQGSFQAIIKTVVVSAQLPTQDEKPMIYPMFLKDATIIWLPTPAFPGTHGPLPFEDPWWKVILCLIAFALLIAGSIEAANAGGEASVGKSGEFASPDSSEHCCDGLEVQASTDSYVAAGLFAAAAAFATAATLSDEADLIDRGRTQTAPGDNDFTVAERAEFKSLAGDAPSPGTPFKGKLSWNYERTLNTGTLSHSATDSYENIHYLDSYKVFLNSTLMTDSNRDYVHPHGKPLLIEASFVKSSQALFRGPELYVFALLWSDAKEKRFFELRDDGDDQSNLDANRGIYRAVVSLAKEESRKWFVFVFAQDVNTVLEGTPPREAAKTIGGALLTTQFVVGMNGRPCELKYDAVLQLT